MRTPRMSGAVPLALDRGAPSWADLFMSLDPLQ
jgi:hypothetical protein